MADKSGETKYHITLEWVDFSGHRRESKEMTEAELEDWLTSIQEGDIFDEIMKEQSKIKVFNFSLGLSLAWIKPV